MYYSAFDLQTGDYFHTGRNSKSKQECIEDIFEYLMKDSEEDISKIKSREKLGIVEGFEVKIDEHYDILL